METCHVKIIETSQVSFQKIQELKEKITVVMLTFILTIVSIDLFNSNLISPGMNSKI
jgi:hypothetical protein